MYNTDFTNVINGAAAKIEKVKKDPFSFFVSSIMAGMFISFALILSITVGGYFDGLPSMKLLMGLMFSSALSMIYFAGSDLFTGSVFTLSSGIIGKKVNVADTIKALIMCYIGNFVGTFIIAIIYLKSNIPSEATLSVVTSLGVAKATGTAFELFLKGILCNTMICFATWIVGRTKDETARLIMIIWIILIFFVSGFEHSIANMSIFAMALIKPVGATMTMGMALNNLLFVTLGNIVGGILFVAVPYSIITREKK